MGTLFILGQQACTVSKALAIQSTRLQFNLLLDFSSHQPTRICNVSFSYKSIIMLTFFFRDILVLQSTFAKYLNK